MYVNGLGFRAIETVKKVHHTTVINWLTEIGSVVPPDAQSEIPEVTEVDELETFIAKKNKIWLWTAVHQEPGILAWVSGERSAKTFQSLWRIINCLDCYLYVTDGYGVYPCFIINEDHITLQNIYDKSCSRSVSPWQKPKIVGLDMIWLDYRRYATSLPLRYEKRRCYSQTAQMLKYSIRLLIYDLRYGSVALRALCARSS